MRKSYLIFLLLAFCFGLISQNRKKDSLVEKLNICREDTQKVKILNQLALLLFTSKPDEARNYTKQALALAKKTGNKKEEAICYKILGTINYYSGDFLRAKDLYLNSLNLTIQVGDSVQIGSSYRNVGLACERLSGDKESIDYFFKALKISEKLKDSSKIAMLQIDIGNAFFALYDFEKAIKYYRSSYVIEEKKGNLQKTAMALNNIGSAYSEEGQYDSGYFYHNKAFGIRKQINDLRGLVTSYMNLADYHIRNKEYKEALAINLNGLKAAREYGEESGLANIMHALMANYINLGDYKKAELYGDSARKLSLGTGYLVTLREIHKSYFEMYRHIGKADAALGNYMLYIKYRDSLQNDDVVRKLTESQLKFEYEKEKEKTKMEQEAKDNLALERENKLALIRNFFIGGFILLLIFMVFVLRSYREKQRTNKIITEQKKLVEEKQKEVMDSIKYAQRIQRSLMPTDKYIERVLTDKKN